ncbi:hypothetical protein Bbelb_390170 [Branchiostoma belcheri]|nr:hypothetical protein Bbelb_390170 [Branchiostoma belcheri]
MAPNYRVFPRDCKVHDDVMARTAMGSKRVAIIGAGVSGLTSIKACLEEGLQPVCFEQHDDLGGVWYYSDDVRPNQGAAMYRSLITNSSKEMMSFSDFPFPKDTPPYLPYHRVYTYLQDYAQHFDLKKHIRFGTQVCNGVFARPYVPDVPGLSDFAGVTMHSQEYRTAQQFTGKKVVVVGAGNSAGDVAAEIAQVASQGCQDNPEKGTALECKRTTPDTGLETTREKENPPYLHNDLQVSTWTCTGLPTTLFELYLQPPNTSALKEASSLNDFKRKCKDYLFTPRHNQSYRRLAASVTFNPPQ